VVLSIQAGFDTVESAIVPLRIIEYKEVALLTQKPISPLDIRFSKEENPVPIECTRLEKPVR
jgi:hypothetical protein